MQGCSSFPVAIATTGDMVVTAGIPGLMGLQESCGFKASSELTHSHSGEQGRRGGTVQLCCRLLPGHHIVPPAQAPRVGRSRSQVWQTAPQPCQALQRLWQPPKAEEGWARDRSGQRREQRTGECRLILSHKPRLGVRLSDPYRARLLWVVLNLTLSPIPSCQDCNCLI